MNASGAWQITDDLLIALRAYEIIGGDIISLLSLRAQAKAEGRDMNSVEIQSLLDEAKSTLDQLEEDLRKKH